MNLRRTLFLAAFFLNGLVLAAQPLPHTLLWRISGKEGHPVSYLYGTMHLTDERLFTLGDSLYAAIRNSDGFAIELDPNAMASFILEEAEKQLTEEKNIKEILSDEEYRTYGPLLAKKLGKPLPSITSEDILHEKNNWIRQSYRTGQMPTFLDAYLFDIARRQHKWTGGVEDLIDQKGIIHDVVDKSDILGLAADENKGAAGGLTLPKMIDIYVRQDLEAIDTLFGNREDRDLILIKRNLKMARRMDSLSGVRSMVFAVGAAHLPGEDGLIHLLREKGFTVEPVFSSRKIRSADYPVPELPDVWEAVNDEDGFYRAEMPGKAGEIMLYGMVKMKTFIDIFKSTGYVVTAVRSSFSNEKTDSLLDQTASRVFAKKNRKDYANIEIDGARGRAYTVTDVDGYKKGYLVSKDGVIYMAFGTATRMTDKNRSDIDHFLRSFHIIATASAPGNEVKANLFVDSSLALSVRVPGTPRLFPTNNGEWNSRLYVSSDLKTGSYYFFGANSVLAGHFIENDSTLLQTLKEEGIKKLKKVDRDTSWMVNGERVIEFTGRMKEVDVLLTTRYISRGNRWYALLAMYPLSGRMPAVDSFFASFTELKEPDRPWQKSVSPDSAFSTWAPQAFTGRAKDSSGTYTYTSFDSLHVISYDVVSYKLGPYYWSVSDSAFWADRIEAKISYRDTLLEKRPITNGDAKGWEWIKKQRGSNLYYRELLLLHGDRLYALVVNSAKSQVHRPEADRFFEEFRLRGPTTANPYLQSQAEPLLRALFDADSATAAKAYPGLSGASFQKKDLPLLYRCLLRQSPLDRGEEGYQKVNSSLVDIVEELKDTGTFQWARQQYPSIPDSLAYLQNSLLRLMATPDSLHFATLVDLLRKDPPAEPLSYFVVSKLADTPALTVKFFPTLLPLLNDTIQRDRMLRLTAQLLDSNSLDAKLLMPYRDQLLTYGSRRVRLLAAPAEANFGAADAYLIAILGCYKDAAANALLTKFLTVKDDNLKLDAIRVLLRNRQPVDNAILVSLARKIDYRLELFHVLDQTNRLDLFPVAWRTQKAFGEAEVYLQMTDNDEDDDDEAAAEKPVISYLREKLVRKGDRQQRFLFYKVSRSKQTWLAGVGPYDPDAKKVSSKDVSAYIDYEEPYSEATFAARMEVIWKKFQEE